MFKFVNFKSFLAVTCIAARLSGFFFISIDFKTFTIKKDFVTKFVFALSCCHSFYSLTYDGHLPIGGISESKVMEKLVNFLLAGVIFSTSYFKLTNFLYNRRIFKVFKDLQWCSDKVYNSTRFRIKHQLKFYFRLNVSQKVLFENVNFCSPAPLWSFTTRTILSCPPGTECFSMFSVL